MSVTSKHKEYSANAPKIKLTRDCVDGPFAIKAAGEAYLPKPNPDDLSQENTKRYEQYLQRAMFLEITGRTKNGLTGAVFRRDPSYELPPKMEYLVEDCDGNGSSLVQLGKLTVGELLEAGNVGLLTEYSSGPAPRTEAESKDRRAFVLMYRAEEIINWRYTKINDEVVLSMVVLQEAKDVSTDEFDEAIEPQYRVLALDAAGYYYQQLYDKDGNLVGAPVYPTMGSSKRWQNIPFVIAGAETNQPGMDDPALYGLATVNIAHYRNSADYEEGVFMHGQGTLFISLGDMPAATFKEMNPQGVLVGARAGIVIGNGGKAELLQMGANGAAREAMQDKEQQMIAIGARLITARSVQQTAEEARINASGESSVLSSIATNASEAIEASLEFAALFHSIDKESVSYELNQEFFDEEYDPQEAMARMMELDRGLIAMSDYRQWLRRTGVIDANRSDEDIDQENGDPDNGDPPPIEDNEQ